MGGKTPAENKSTKDITLPVVLICNLTLLACLADGGMRAKVRLSRSSREHWFASEGL